MLSLCVTHQPDSDTQRANGHPDHWCRTASRITDIDAAARDLVAVDTPVRDFFPDRGGLGDQEVWVSPLETAT